MSSAPAPTLPEGSLGGEVEDSSDFREHWRTLIRRRWLVIPFFLATVLVTTLISLRQTKIYSATCTIIIDVAAPKVLEKDQLQEVVETGTGGYWFSKEYYETQYKVLGSRTVAQRVADKLQLATNDRFLEIDGARDQATREAMRKRCDPVAILQQNLRIEPVKDSRIVRVRYENPDPQLTAEIANAFAAAYIAENLAVRTFTTQGASEWLEQQLGDLELKLGDSGKKLFDFKREHDIVATSWEDRQSMVSQRLTAINDALTKARVRKAELQARNEAVAVVGHGVDDDRLLEADSAPGITDNLAIQGLKLRYF